MGAQLMAVAYCVAMALMSRLVPMCPCCGSEVRISRLVAAITWACLAGGLLVVRGRRFELYAGMTLLSCVQAANFWQQFRHDEMSVSSFATWTMLAAVLGVLVFGTLAVTAKRKVAAR